MATISINGIKEEISYAAFEHSAPYVGEPPRFNYVEVLNENPSIGYSINTYKELPVDTSFLHIEKLLLTNGSYFLFNISDIRVIRDYILTTIIVSAFTKDDILVDQATLSAINFSPFFFTETLHAINNVKTWGFMYTAIWSGSGISSLYRSPNAYQGIDKTSSFYDGISVFPFPGDESGNNGGDGDFNNGSDDIDFPTLPIITGLSTKMISMHAPTIPQLNDFADFLWGSQFDQVIAKLFQDPMEAILSLSLFNCPIPNGADNEIVVGGVGSKVTSKTIENQHVVLDCGTMTIKEYWGSALDYSPHTKVQIYLPYLGIQDLNTDDVMRSTLNIRYHIDLLTGASNIMIKVTKDGLSSILYNYSCNVSTQIPISGRNMSQIVDTMIKSISSVGVVTAVGTGGIAGVAAVAAGGAMSTISAKTHVQRSGRLDANAGTLGNKKPYIIISRPIQSLAKGYNSFRGYPSNITSVLSNLSGFTKVSECHLDGINATDLEKNEIETLLKGGIIL